MHLFSRKSHFFKNARYLFNSHLFHLFSLPSFSSSLFTTIITTDTPPPAHPPISDHLPRFIVSLPDTNLFCFSIEGFELFSYNLLSTPQLHVNSFFNITRTPDGEWVRGGTDLGFLLKIKDDRVKNRQRVFKIKVYGAEKKAEFAGFGQVDMKG